MINKDISEVVQKSINQVQLYVMFQTDMDFGVDIDGLESFINSGLKDDCSKYSFAVEHIPLGDHEDNHRLIKLSVSYPWWRTDNKKDPWWHSDAIDEVISPAYMWLYARIGTGNRHALSRYYTNDPFYDVFSGYSDVNIKDGVIICPQTDIMSGNYSGSWAQWRFVCDDAENYGDDKEFIERVKSDLDAKYGDED